VTKLLDYFHTDWAAMTRNDWLGVFFTVGAFIAMIVVYVMVFNPKNKDVFNAQADVALRDEDDKYSGDRK
jgi:cytochrome c oxidase cbb3-type subunit 4